MVSMGLRTFGYVFGLLALYAFWLDLRLSNQPSIALGRFWFDHHAGSLQVIEAVISRYIDPCSLIVGLGCSPFLWHPLIASVLGWPATLVLILLMLVFLGLAGLLRARALRRTSGRSLKRSGDR